MNIRQLAAYLLSLPDEVQDLEAFTYSTGIMIPVNDVELQYVEPGNRWTGLNDQDLVAYKPSYVKTLIKVAVL